MRTCVRSAQHAAYHFVEVIHELLRQEAIGEPSSGRGCTPTPAQGSKRDTLSSAGNGKRLPSCHDRAQGWGSRRSRNACQRNNDRDPPCFRLHGTPPRAPFRRGGGVSPAPDPPPPGGAEFLEVPKNFFWSIITGTKDA